MSIHKVLLKLLHSSIIKTQVAFEEKDGLILTEGLTETPKPGRNNSKYSLEYYPESKKYYAKYKNGYLKRRFSTGMIEVDEFIWADSFQSENSALSLCKLHQEQQGKVGVITISVDL